MCVAGATSGADGPPAGPDRLEQLRCHTGRVRDQRTFSPRPQVCAVCVPSFLCSRRATFVGPRCCHCCRGRSYTTKSPRRCATPSPRGNRASAWLPSSHETRPRRASRPPSCLCAQRGHPRRQPRLPRRGPQPRPPRPPVPKPRRRPGGCVAPCQPPAPTTVATVARRQLHPSQWRWRHQRVAAPALLLPASRRCWTWSTWWQSL